MVNFIHFLHASTESQLLETIRSIHALVPQSALYSESRRERVLLSFIGSLAKGIVGTATIGGCQPVSKPHKLIKYKLQMYYISMVHTCLLS